MFSVFCVLIMAGAGCIFFVNGGYDANASYSDGRLTYTFDSALPEDFSFTVYSNARLPDMIYLFSDDGVTNVQSADYQNGVMDDFEKILKDRGFSDVSRIDSGSLKQKIADGSEHNSAVLFASNEIPSSVAASGLDGWMSLGNTVYWIGGGLKPLLGDSVNENWKSKDLTEEERKECYGTVATEFARMNDIGFQACSFGMRAGYGLDLGICSEDYCSIAVKNWSSGRLMVFGGNLYSIDEADTKYSYALSSAADCILSGVTEDSEIIAHEAVHKGFLGYSGSADIAIPHDSLMMLKVGKPYSKWTRTIAL